VTSLAVLYEITLSAYEPWERCMVSSTSMPDTLLRENINKTSNVLMILNVGAHACFEIIDVYNEAW